MPFIESALSSGQLAAIRDRPHRADYYFLAWGGNTPEAIIVFKARVNQASFDNSFATITFDTTTATPKGAYTDAIEGYTIYLSTTNDISNYYWRGRLRVASTATVLGVNETSVTIADDDYIFVTKDTPIARKNANKSTAFLMDFDISYRAPPPIVKDLQTVYAVVLDSSGNGDTSTLTPVGIAVTSGASISSYAWTADGGSFIVGSAATQTVQIRYTVAGYYRPRVTVTDSNGLTSWFSPYVFVIPNDYSGIANLGFDGLSLTATIDTGWDATVAAFAGVENILDNTLVATYEPGDHITVTSDITFVGRIRNEANSGAMSQQHGLDPKVSFDIEGVGTQLGRLISRPVTYFDETTPTTFTGIKDCTPWRAVSEYVREFTNLNNTHSLQFDDVTDQFQFASYSTGSTSTLDSITNIIFVFNGAIEWAASGEMKITRRANYLPTADRNALTTIANFTLKEDYATEGGDGTLYDLPIDYIRPVGNNITYGGSYDTTTGSITALKSTTPAVVQSDGNEKSETNRQVLVADLTKAQAATELGQRAGDDFAAKQANPVLTITHPDSYRWMQPSVSTWWTHTIARNENLRGLVYTTSTRWLISSVDISYDLATQRRVVSVSYPIETTDLGFSTAVEEPPLPTQYSVPVQPVMDTFPGFISETFGTDLPSTDEADEQPVTANDLAPQTDAKDPQVQITLIEQSGGGTLMTWNDTQLWRTDNITSSALPEWVDTRLTATGVIQDAVWDTATAVGTPAFSISNDGTDSYAYVSTNLGKAIWFEPGDTLSAIELTQIRLSSADSVIAYGIANNYPAGAVTINLLAGNGNDNLSPSDLDVTHGGTKSNAPGVYNSGLDAYDGAAGDGGGLACNIQFAIPPGLTVQKCIMWLEYTTNAIGQGGERRCDFEMFSNGTSIEIGHEATIGTGSASYPPGASFVQLVNFTVQGDTVLLHAAVRTDTPGSDTLRIRKVRITGTAIADVAATALSDDRAANFDPLRSVGLMSLGAGSFDVRRGTSGLAAMDEKVRIAPPGDTYSDEADGGAGAGQYPKAIWGLGPDTDDYLFATDDGVLYIVVDGLKADITPAGGVVVGKDGLTANGQLNIWGLIDYSGTVKASYSINGGVDWAHNTQVSNSATAIRVSPGNNKQVYIADGATIWYSADGGVTYVSRPSPSATCKGISLL